MPRYRSNQRSIEIDTVPIVRRIIGRRRRRRVVERYSWLMKMKTEKINRDRETTHTHTLNIIHNTSHHIVIGHLTYDHSSYHRWVFNCILYATPVTHNPIFALFISLFLLSFLHFETNKHNNTKNIYQLLAYHIFHSVYLPNTHTRIHFNTK